MSGNLEDEVKALIIKALGLEHVRPEDIISDAPLFGEGLGLDSIDALELGIAIYNTYGIRMEAGDKSMRHHFQSVAHLSRFIGAKKDGRGGK